MDDKLPEVITVEGVGVNRQVGINDAILDIKQSIEVHKHSVEFNWGYNGSGPTQLALAILLKYMPAKEAEQLVASFRNLTVANFPQESFKVELRLADTINRIKEARKSGRVPESAGLLTVLYDGSKTKGPVHKGTVQKLRVNT